ncbi:MAG: phosphatase PAP2 family protein, partial [Bacteroidota bacterium]
LGGWGSQTRLKKLQDKPGVTQAELEALDPGAVPGIDRIALRRNWSSHKSAIVQSDNIFSVGQVLPFGLFVWKKYRRDWWQITLMYFEAQASQGLIYGFAPFGPTQTNRFRPRVYYDENERFDGNQRNSTFSGHVSTTATGFYFTAKMIDDYNPDLTGGQRLLLYTAASVPSIYVGWLRVRALKHFPTDSAIGLGVGAFSGIMIPEFHRWWAKRHRSRAMIQPIYTGDVGGLGFSLVF